MFELFSEFFGDLPVNYNVDLMLVLSAQFALFLLTEFCRFLSIMVDYIFKRKS